MKLLIPAVFLSVLVVGCTSTIRQTPVFCASESAALPDTDFIQSDFPCETGQVYVLCAGAKPFCSDEPRQTGSMHTLFEPVALHLEGIVAPSLSCMFRFEMEGNISDEEDPDLEQLEADLEEEEFERSMND